jgi:hypothetical protein
MIASALAWLCRKRVKKGRQINDIEIPPEVPPKISIDVYDGIPLTEIITKEKNGQSTP